MSNNDFRQEVLWRDVKASVTYSISPFTHDTAWVMVVYAPNTGWYNSYIIEMQADENGVWAPRADEAGILAWDVSKSGPFVRMNHNPIEGYGGTDQVNQNLQRHGAMLAEKGLQRERMRLADEIKTCKLKIDAGKFWIAKATDQLEAKVEGFDPGTLLIQVSPSESPHVLREVVDTEIGPLVLKILSADRFTLSAPKSISRDYPASVRKCTWKAGVWSGMPETQEQAVAICRIGETIRVDRVRDFKRAGWGDIAFARHEIMIEEKAVEMLEEVTLPRLQEKLRELDYVETPAWTSTP